MQTLKFREFINGKFHYWGFVEEGIFKGPATPSLIRGKHDMFSGLILDKEEIYSGDIVKYFLEEPFGDRTEYIEVVEFSDGQFCCETTPLYAIIEWDCKLIGNIHENSELLN